MSTTETTIHDVVVVGAGFAGMYTTIHGVRAGLDVLGIEAGSDVGGTWYWNRYPGARCDVESVDYSYSFDETLQKEWRWSERYATQPEILRYLSHVAERFDVRRHYRFGTKVTGAHWDEPAQLWKVSTSSGDTVSARWLVMATGSLSKPNLPDLPGRDSFAGPVYMTAAWPAEGVDFSGLRVGVIGTGSSGVQSIPLIAEQAAALTVFQRTANYSVPAFNRTIDDAEWQELLENYPQRRAASWNGAGGSPWGSFSVPYETLTPEERERVLAEAWTRGGVLYGKAFERQTVDVTVNGAAREYFEQKLRGIVPDEQLADDLTPNDHPLGTKRICTDSGYFETFTLPHVRLVNLRRDPITAITPNGVQTDSGFHELDAIVYATGFDALTGALTSIDIVGREGRTVREAWQEGPLTYLGIGVPGFPNLLTLNGPGSPSVLANMALGSEQQGAYALRLILHAAASGFTAAEPRTDAAAAWTTHLGEVAEKTLFADAPTWYTGANIPGKPRIFMPYLGGFNTYIARLDEVAEDGFRGFVFSER